MFSALCERWQCKRDRAGIPEVPEAAFCSVRYIPQDNGSFSTPPVNNKGTYFAQGNVEQPFQLWIQCGQHWLCWSAGERREAAGCCWGPWVLWLHTVRTAVGLPSLPSHICSQGELSKLCFQVSTAGLRSRGPQLPPGLAGTWTAAPPLFICFMIYLFWVPKFDATELPVLILSIDWVFPSFFPLLLCYP